MAIMSNEAFSQNFEFFGSAILLRQSKLGTTANKGTRVLTPDVVYLRWANIETKVLARCCVPE